MVDYENQLALQKLEDEKNAQALKDAQKEAQQELDEQDQQETEALDDDGDTD